MGRRAFSISALMRVKHIQIIISISIFQRVKFLSIKCIQKYMYLLQDKIPSLFGTHDLRIKSWCFDLLHYDVWQTYSGHELISCLSLLLSIYSKDSMSQNGGVLYPLIKNTATSSKVIRLQKSYEILTLFYHFKS